MNSSSNPAAYASMGASGPRRASLVQIGASLGVASNCIGWLIFCLMCAGYGAAVNLALLPFALGLVGMVLTVVGAVGQKNAGDVDTHILASIFINLFGIIAGLLQMSVWRHWTLMPT